MGLRLIGLLLGLAIGGLSQQTCPIPSAIAPCYCQGGFGNGRLVECDRIDSFETFQRILFALKGLRIHTFEIYKTNIGDGYAKSLPYDLFNGFTITNLIIKKSFFTKFETSAGQLPFSGLEGCLESLRLVDIKVANPSPILLSHLRYLSLLDISGYEIPTLTGNWFRYPPPVLRHLGLNRNGIRLVDATAFSRIQNLEILELMSNEITTLEPTVFPKSLRKLHLNMNQISTLSGDLLKALPILQLLDLSSNRIISLSEPTWGVLSRLAHVDVTYNPLNCTEDMLWIPQQKRDFWGTCASPDNLRNTELRELQSKFPKIFHSQ